MRGCILQPGYLPWLGFFEQYVFSDIFVFLDDVQYTKQDWRNRNRIRSNTQNGWTWMTVPVRAPESKCPIHAVAIDYSRNWTKKHLHLLTHNYRNTPHFDEVFGIVKRTLDRRFSNLADLCIELVAQIALYMQVRRETYRTSELGIEEKDKNLRLIAICRRLGIDFFYDGSKAEKFLDPALFVRSGIRVKLQHYDHPCYRQIYEPFVPYLSVVDLLFNHGRESGRILIRDPELTSRDLEENQLWGNVE